MKLSVLSSSQPWSSKSDTIRALIKELLAKRTPVKSSTSAEYKWVAQIDIRGDVGNTKSVGVLAIAEAGTEVFCDANFVLHGVTEVEKNGHP